MARRLAMARLGVTEFKARAAAILGAQAFQKSALNIRDGAGVFDRVLGSGAYRTVLEIGTYRGISAAYMAQFCDRVVTIDLAHGKREHNGETFDRAGFWHAMGVAERIELHLVAGAADKAALIARLEFDLAFIDGGKTDIADDFAAVRRCGAVLFHDYDRRGGPDTDSVYDFVNTLPRHQVEAMDIFALWLDRQRGLDGRRDGGPA